MKKYFLAASLLAVSLSFTSAQTLSTDSVDQTTSNSPIPKVEFIGTPTLQLQPSGKGSSLVGKLQVKITVGNQAIAVYPRAVAGVIQFSKGTQGATYANSMTFTATSAGLDLSNPGVPVTLAANKSYLFSITNTVKTAELFAGTYTMQPSNFYYNLASDPYNSYLTIQAPEFRNANASKAVTIIGETSPYISYITSDASGQITITGARLNLTSNVVTVDGAAIGYPIGKATATSITFKASAFNVSTGWHTFLITNASVGNSNAYYALVQGGPVSTPTVEFIGTPTIKLQYDSNGKEALLVGKGMVKITAGNTAIGFNGTSDCCNFIAQLLQFNNGDQISTNSRTFSAVNSQGLTTIPANTSATFTIVNTLKTSELFAGSYRFKPTMWDFAYTDADGTGNYAVSNSSFINPSSSNSITIVGETSPYISRASIDANSNLTVSGARLNLAGNYLQVDGMGNSMVSKFNPTATSFTANIAQYQLAPGYHSVQIVNSTTGNSNFGYINVTSPSGTSTADIASATLAASSPMSQFVVGGTTFGIATFTIRSTPGSSLYVRTLGFYVSGGDEIQSVTVGGVTAPNNAGKATVSGLSIPVTQTGTDIPVAIKFAGFQNSTVGGVLTRSGSYLSIALLDIDAVNSVDGTRVKKSVSVSSNPMTLVASKPTITVGRGGINQLVLGAENKIGEITVTADATGQISFASTSLSIAAVGVSSPQISSPRIADGATTITGSWTSLNNMTLGFGFSPAYTIMPGQSKTFSIYAVVNGTVQSGGVIPYIASRLTGPAFFGWIDNTGGNVAYTGDKIFNFPTNSYTTATGATPTPPPAPTRLITPNGGEKVVIGAPYAITWDSADIGNLQINLVQQGVTSPYGGPTECAIAILIPSTSRSYTWTPKMTDGCPNMPNGLDLAGSYKIELRSNVTGSGSTLADGSDGSFTFTTSNPTSPPVPAPTPTPPTTNIPVISITAVSGSKTYKVTNGSTIKTTDGTVKFVWSTKNVDPESHVEDGCTLNASPIPASGNQTYTGLTSASYTFTCTNAAGSASVKFKISSSLVLGESASNTCTNLTYNIHRGNESAATSKLQSFLLANGFLSGEVTGFYGDKTVEAVKAYQASHNLPQTGMAYNFTRQAIAQDSCK